VLILESLLTIYLLTPQLLWNKSIFRCFTYFYSSFSFIF